MHKEFEPHDMNRYLRRAFVGLALGLQVTRAEAQTTELKGIIRERLTGQPLAGVVVTLVDSAHSVLLRTRSMESGQFWIQAPVEALRLRVQRLGFAPQEMVLSKSDVSAALDIQMDRVAALLQPVEVRASPQCPVRPDYGRAQSLLEQARAGVLSFVLARELRPVSLIRATYIRRVEAKKNRIIEQSVHVDSTDGRGVSFLSERSGGDFVARGFRNDSADGELLGPDAAVLLDEDFAAGYCFHVASPERSRPTQTGLAFAPARRKPGRVDIDGVLWIDTVARRLVDLEYRYVGLGEADALRPGGRTSFHELSSGIVLVDRWSIHFPERRLVVPLPGGRAVTSPYSSDITIENGGDVVLAAWTDGTVWRPLHPGLRLRVASASGQGLSGVRVALANTGYQAFADSEGVAVIQGLIPGKYQITVSDPRLPQAELIPAPVQIEVDGDSTTSAVVKASTLAEYAVDRCRSDRRFTTPEAPLLGYVGTAEGGPAANAEVTYGEPGHEPLYRFRLGEDGIFAVCLGRDQRVDSLELNVRKGTLQGVVSTIHGDNFQIANVRLGAPIGGQTLTSTLRGLVFDSLHGRPMAGALVGIDGNHRTAFTDFTGGFTFDSVPNGFHTITVEHQVLDAIGISRLSGTYSVSRPGELIRLDLPSFGSLWQKICGRPGGPPDSAIVIGTVRSADSLHRRLAANVDAIWTIDAVDQAGRPVERRWTIPARSDSAGGFALCGLPVGTPVHLRAELDSGSTDLITLNPLAEERIVIRNLMIGVRDASRSTTSGVIMGVVMRDSLPLVGANVTTESGTSVRSGADGRFILSGVPAGTRQVEARTIGLTPATAIVDLMANDTARVTLRMSQITTLDSVLVTAERSEALRAFEEHRKMGLGKFLTLDDLKKSDNAKLSTLLRQWPGLHIPADPLNSYPQTTRGVKSLQGGCNVAVFLDGRLLDPKLDKDLDHIAPPDQLAGIEWYAGGATVPPEYVRLNAHCGVLVLHSRYKVGKSR
jgi:hypothetical protein